VSLKFRNGPAKGLRTHLLIRPMENSFTERKQHFERDQFIARFVRSRSSPLAIVRWILIFETTYTVKLGNFPSPLLRRTAPSVRRRRKPRHDVESWSFGSSSVACGEYVALGTKRRLIPINLDAPKSSKSVQSNPWGRQ
jgi:hypothetical protein